ncbi:pancreatic triacylglycerol lipase [Aplysia californica]|uniref:Pancreatic triacylglycerol lipase n=1 Tax=Aplysia californica TaxID=6500 RepID=A0ABM0JS14_APLCA|nr:pancreatic triacylglycerol lipase [Aplysia californica]
MFVLTAVVVCVLTVLHGVEPKALRDTLEQHRVETRSTKCYPRVGCFSGGAPFYSLERPLNLLPQSPDTIQTKYMLYTRESKTKEVVLDARHPDQHATVWTNYKSRPTKFLVHGFLDSVLVNPWLKELKNELLTYGDYNVIIVDWHHGNAPPYTQATGNTRLVGAQIADLIKTLKGDHEQSAADFHVIGHSLGAHIAGYAGERVPGMGRISGMDPAGPYFEDTDKVVRLDSTDATFVDIVHTDGDVILHLGFGLKQQIGHADYYPNLGHDQPGCQKDPISQIADNGVVQGTQEFVACNHLRSWKFYTESINSQCPFMGFPCASEDDFQAGRCHSCTNGTCGRMGFHADKVVPPKPTRYFLTTADHAPFCEYHMEVKVQLHSGGTHERGEMKAMLTGDKGSTGWITMNKDPIDYQPGAIYTYTLGVPSNIGHVTKVEFSWHHMSSVSNPFKWNILGLRHPVLVLDEVDIHEQELGDTVKFCVSGASVETDRRLVLNRNC